MTYLNKYLGLTIISVILSGFIPVFGQHYLPVNQPEQDACHPIMICQDSVVVPFSYQKRGLKQDLVNENNSLWFRLEIAASGILTYELKKNNPADNFSVRVFQPATGNCEMLGPVIRAGLVLIPNTFVPESRRVISATSGDIYYIEVEGYGEGSTMFDFEPTSGFTLDFSSSSATFVKGSPPVIDSIPLKCPNYNRILVHLSKPVQCSSIDEDGSGFDILSATSPSGSPVTTPYVQGIGCTMDDRGYTAQLKITFGSFLPPGAYTLRTKSGNDGNSLLDMCDEPMPVSTSEGFFVPDVDDTVNIITCPSQMPFLWNGITVADSGSNAASYFSENILGCDSVTILNLSLSDTLRDTVIRYICEAELPFSWHQIVVNDTGVNVANYYSQSSGGCDSLTTLNLHIIVPKNQLTNASSCGPYVYEGQAYDHSQLISDTIKSSSNCDSVYLLINLTVYPELIPDLITVDTSSCGFVLFKGNIYTENQTIYDTLFSDVDCDSIYRTINIQVYPNTQPVKYYDTIYSCDEAIIDGISYDQDTVVVDIFSNVIGCDSAARITTVIIEPLNLQLSANPPIPVKGDLVTLTAGDNITGTVITSWQPNDLFTDQHAPTQYFFISEEDTFIVTGISPRGCADSDTLYLKPDSLIPKMVIPNAFTPNGDGRNDRFTPNFINPSGHVIRQIRIIDRWGQTVYKNYNKRQISWDGTIGWNQKPAPAGTYFYYIDIEYLNGVKDHLSGAVHLLR